MSAGCETQLMLDPSLWSFFSLLDSDWRPATKATSFASSTLATQCLGTLSTIWILNRQPADNSLCLKIATVKATQRRCRVFAALPKTLALFLQRTGRGGRQLDICASADSKGCTTENLPAYRGDSIRTSYECTAFKVATREGAVQGKQNIRTGRLRRPRRAQLTAHE